MYSLKNETVAVRRLVLAACAVVLLVHAIVVLALGDHFLLGSYDKRDNDDVKYVYAAQHLLGTGTLVYNSGDQPTNYIMPTIPVMLSGFIALFGRDDGVMAFRLLQCLFQAASIYLIFIIARKLFGTRAAVIATVASVFYIPDLFASGAVLTESTFKFLFLLLISVLFHALDKKSAAAYALFGVMLGLCCYVKPQCALIPVCLLVLWLVRKYSWKSIVTFTAVIGVCSMALLSPWWIRNYADFGEFIPFTKSTGNPMLLGALISRQAPPKGFFEQYPQYNNDNLFVGSDNWERQAAQRLIGYYFKHEPLRYAYWVTVGKSFRLFSQPFYSRPVPGFPRPAINIFHWLYTSVGFIGLILLLAKRRFVQSLQLLLPFSYYWLIHLPFITFARYGYPLMSPLTILGAAGFALLLARNRNAAAASGSGPLGRAY